MRRSPSWPRAAEAQPKTTRTFTGRLGAKALAPGRYRLRLGAVDVAGNRSRPASVAFRVVR